MYESGLVASFDPIASKRAKAQEEIRKEARKNEKQETKELTQEILEAADELETGVNRISGGLITQSTE